VEVEIIVDTINAPDSITKIKGEGLIQQYINVSSVLWRRRDPCGFVIQPRKSMERIQ
jgi:hypothetical protein